MPIKYLRRLYDWVLSWAHHPMGGIALLFLAFIESSVFLIPPDPLLIGLTLGKRSHWLRFAVTCTVGSVLGGLFGYFIGYQLWDWTSDFFFNHMPGFTPEAFEKMKAYYDQYKFWIVFTSGFTPIPYKLFTISSGVFHISLIGFTVASACGRALRFFLVAFLVGRYGEPIHNFIDRYFGILTYAFVAALIGGVYVVKFLLH